MLERTTLRSRRRRSGRERRRPTPWARVARRVSPIASVAEPSA